jgi:fructoselysine-6-P-deglycase FrlB-like protein
MGKPFKSELNKLENTYKWALSIELKDLFDSLFSKDAPFFIVGSGGSFSVCTYVAFLLQQRGVFAKAVTPLELIYATPLIRKSSILLISASGKNKDIILAAKACINHDAQQIITICLTKDTLLSNLVSKVGNATTFEFPIPAGKDGFLATNSLIAYFTIFERLFGDSKLQDISELSFGDSRPSLDKFAKQLPKSPTFVVLYGGYGQCVAVDIESKFTEAALGNISLSDYRNFGHGRHHWFAKRASTSAVVALISPNERQIAEKTLSLLPKKIPRLIMSTETTSPSGAIELLIKSFWLANRIGEIQKIDPGKPGVPSFGSKLYNLNALSIYKKMVSHSASDLAIIKKSSAPTLAVLSDNEVDFWKKSKEAFISILNKKKFGCLVLDYDGTICDNKHRFEAIEPRVKLALNTFLSKGFILGVISGRGKSIREALQDAIEYKYWEQVILGYYNGADIGILPDNNLPIKDENSIAPLNSIGQILNNHILLSPMVDITYRPKQITIEAKKQSSWSRIKPIVYDLIAECNYDSIKVMESSHSMDVILRPIVSKLNILEYCSKASSKLGVSSACLCMGDKGKYPGNDFELLATPFSLSVDEVSSNSSSGWNFAPPGLRGVEALLFYFKTISFSKTHFSIKLS